MGIDAIAHRKAISRFPLVFGWPSVTKLPVLLHPTGDADMTMLQVGSADSPRDIYRSLLKIVHARS